MVVDMSNIAFFSLEPHFQPNQTCRPDNSTQKSKSSASSTRLELTFEPSTWSKLLIAKEKTEYEELTKFWTCPVLLEWNNGDNESYQKIEKLCIIFKQRRILWAHWISDQGWSGREKWLWAFGLEMNLSFEVCLFLPLLYSLSFIVKQLP